MNAKEICPQSPETITFKHDNHELTFGFVADDFSNVFVWEVITLDGNVVAKPSSIPTGWFIEFELSTLMLKEEGIVLFTTPFGCQFCFSKEESEQLISFIKPKINYA